MDEVIVGMCQAKFRWACGRPNIGMTQLLGMRDWIGSIFKKTMKPTDRSAKVTISRRLKDVINA